MPCLDVCWVDAAPTRPPRGLSAISLSLSLSLAVLGFPLSPPLCDDHVGASDPILILIAALVLILILILILIRS